MLKKISYYFLFMLVSSVCAQKEKLPVISKAEELKTVKSQKIIWKKDGAKMVFVPANPEGTGMAELVYDELGEVTNKGEVVSGTEAFFMDMTEVTIAQFKMFLKSSGYKTRYPINWNRIYHNQDPKELDKPDEYPITFISWRDATAYAKWAGKRLPTKDEWSFAFWGGLKGPGWIDDEWVDGEWIEAWGARTIDKANLKSGTHPNSPSGKDIWYYQTAPVGSFKPNGYGLHDMLGNVWEWCQDHSWPIRRDRENNPVAGGYEWQSAHYAEQGYTAAEHDFFRVIMGGSYGTDRPLSGRPLSGNGKPMESTYDPSAWGGGWPFKVSDDHPNILFRDGGFRCISGSNLTLGHLEGAFTFTNYEEASTTGDEETSVADGEGAFAKKEELPVISKAEELKTVKGKKIIWQEEANNEEVSVTGEELRQDNSQTQGIQDQSKLPLIGQSLLALLLLFIVKYFLD